MIESLIEVQYIIGWGVHVVAGILFFLAYLRIRNNKKISENLRYVVLLMGVLSIVISGMPLALSQHASLIKHVFEFSMLSVTATIIYYLMKYIYYE